MIRDHSYRSSYLTSSRQKAEGKKRKNHQSPADGWLWKTTGMVVSAALVLGIAASFWFDWLIKNTLDELAENNAIRQEMIQTNQALLASREQLLDKSRIEAVAAEQGLYLPASSQLRRP